MKRPPCIRGLSAFKKGCPQRSWDGASGCPAWIDKKLPIKGSTEFIEVKECLDLFMARLAYDGNGLLEGNQQAVESFRNGMINSAGPRPDPALCKLIAMIEEQQQHKLIGN